MEIECEGCYYTLCSFVCLTEDLSEILKFLWRHGCLRRSYFCDKCGRKCAIGDKDLFFRCNRNALETPFTQQQPQNLPVQSSTQQILSFQQTPPQTQTNGTGQTIIHHPIDQTTHHQYIIAHPNLTSISEQNRIIPIQNTNTTNLLSINEANGLQHSEPYSDNSIRSDSVIVCSTVTGSVLNNGEVNQQEKILNPIVSQENQLIHGNSQEDNLIKTEELNSHIIPVQTRPLSSLDLKTEESTSEEPPSKVLKKSKSEGTKTSKKRCNFKVSMKKGTFFEKSKLPIDTVCKFVVFWCCMKNPTQEFLRNELSLATRTVVDWSTACREICIHWAKSVSQKIGGEGVMVQIDEVKIQDNKESKQNDNGNRFSFWGMEKDRERGKIFIVPVPACDSWTLLAVVNDWILPGSVIISNCWKAYDCLKLQEFIQQTVVQSKTFVHPQNQAGQQNLDVKVNEAGASAGGELQMPKFGTRRSHHLGDLAEFMFKRRYSNHLERIHVFFKQIARAYPLR